jgi:hypothetical protein
MDFSSSRLVVLKVDFASRNLDQEYLALSFPTIQLISSFAIPSINTAASLETVVIAVVDGSESLPFVVNVISPISKGCPHQP